MRGKEKGRDQQGDKDPVEGEERKGWRTAVVATRYESAQREKDGAERRLGRAGPLRKRQTQVRDSRGQGWKVENG